MPTGLSSSEKVGYAILCAGLVAFSGICSGLTLGLLSLDHVDLEVLRRSGTPTQKIQAAGVAPVRARRDGVTAPRRSSLLLAEAGSLSLRSWWHRGTDY